MSRIIFGVVREVAREVVASTKSARGGTHVGLRKRAIAVMLPLVAFGIIPTLALAQTRTNAGTQVLRRRHSATKSVPAKTPAPRPRSNSPSTTTDNWTDGSGTDNNWSTMGNWDNGVPTITSDVVIPFGPPTPNVDVPLPEIHDLTLNSGSLFLNTNALGVHGNISNNSGQLVLNAGGLGVLSTSVTLSGTGVLTMSDNAKNLISSPSLGNTFINDSTIQGAGQINTVDLINNGAITANQPDFPLQIFPSSNGVKNSGTLGASGGTLLLRAGLYSNSGGGGIEGNGASVVLDGANIVGGTLRTSGSGTIGQLFQGKPPTLNGLTLEFGCQYQLNSGDVTNLQGTITNDGQIKLTDASGTGTKLIMQAATMAGSGVILLNGATTQISGSGLINQQTIQGNGTVNVGAFENLGTIIGDSTTAPFTIVCPTGAGTCLNPGTVEGEGGGTVVLTCPGSGGCTLDNIGGNVLHVYIKNGLTLEGGLLDGTNEGQDATLDGTTNSGEFDIFNGDITRFKNIFINNGTVEMTAVNCSNPCPSATAEVSGNVSVTGTGTWDLKSVPGFTTLFEGETGSDTLTNSSTIQGTGIIGNNSMNFTNAVKGVVNANSSLPFTFTMGPAHVFKNMGLVSVAANSALIVTGKFGNFNSATSTLTGGTFLVDGIFQFDNANIVKNAAKLTIAGEIVNQNNGNALQNFANNTAAGSFTVLPQNFGGNFTSAGPFNNEGKVIIVGGVAFFVGGSSTNYNQTGGTTTVDGRLGVPLGGLVNITGGTLQGGGAPPAGATISGNVSVGNASTAAATFIIGDSNKKSGLIAVANNYSQLATGVMDVQIGGTTAGTQYSQLNVTGTAALNGTLNIKLTNKFKPTVGQTFTILNASSGITGTFSVVNGTSINSNEHFSLSYTGSTVVLTVVSGAA
jgi:fibronectin-binding autotransporter adhesin